jgi:putative tryptophan/tyrosine transport system substrate-binding protein
MIGVDYDPVARGYVHSLARPGGNITGVSLNTVEVAAKRVEILKETVPGVSRCRMGAVSQCGALCGAKSRKSLRLPTEVGLRENSGHHGA